MKQDKRPLDQPQPPLTSGARKVRKVQASPRPRDPKAKGTEKSNAPLDPESPGPGVAKVQGPPRRLLNVFV